jgi:hypothetical protein
MNHKTYLVKDKTWFDVRCNNQDIKEEEEINEVIDLVCAFVMKI